MKAFDRTLQDIRDDLQPMGGLVVLLAGDFRQTLPVVTRGTPADELNACLKSSYLWSHIVKMHLTVNMRVQLHNDTTAAKFADELLKIGEGRLETDSEDNVQFSNTFCQVVESSETEVEVCPPNDTSPVLPRRETPYHEKTEEPARARAESNCLEEEEPAQIPTCDTETVPAISPKQPIQSRNSEKANLSSETGLSVGLCHQIVTKDLDMIQTSSKFVPRILTEEQKEVRMDVCKNMVEMTRTDPEWMQKNHYRG
ncbi:hypothetical protein LAZ67_1000841 [Cordylochernes scorpioides]|uniref:ATP-dependent DNA helicase n=1 Tax=Cordylochernes scorpioides TaxID=51811 RepID=A0ABY6JUY4_9ARAC|nr:hypothetical protein LAZ67_1000841 [Cordylochernes scorpioides]